MNRARESYSNNMYTILSLSEMEKERHTHPKALINYLIDRFTVRHKMNFLSQIKNCISVSLFCQNVDNKVPKKIDHAVVLQKGQHWHTKYYSSLVQFVKDFQSSELYSSFKIRVYLENQLKHFAREIKNMDPSRIEIFLMKTNSIGAQPGMLWRYLAFDDKLLNIAFVSDVDVHFESHVVSKVTSFISSQKTFGRFLPWHKNDFLIDHRDPKSPLNYAVCLGSCIAMRPKQFRHKFTVRRCMINYILHRIRRSKISKFPWEEKEGFNTKRFNKPVGDHIYGWGGFWTMYGFDEKFFKHTLFPYFVDRGQVLTWTGSDNVNMHSTLPDTHPFAIDVRYMKSVPQNEIILLP